MEFIFFLKESIKRIGLHKKTKKKCDKQNSNLHVFIVHNYITYIVSKSIIKHLNINIDDVLILSFRGFKQIDSELPQNIFPFPDYDSNYFEPSIIFFRGILKLRKFDKKVKQLTFNRKFILYILGLANIKSFYAFKSHPKCIEHSYIEEGAISYNSFEYFTNNNVIKYSNKYKIINYLNFMHRINSNVFRFYFDDYSKAYCISKEAFPNWKRKILLPILDEFFIKKPSSNIKHVLVLEGLVKAGYGSNANYFELLIRFNYFCQKTGINEVFYKHHPSTKNISELDELIQSFEKVKFSKLDNSTCLESLAISNKSITFYGTISSILIYSKVLGAKSISFSNTYEEIIGRKFDQIPKYMSNIQSIEI